MKWLEIIELRSVGHRLKIVEPELRNLIEQINKKSSEKKITVYSRFEVNSDFSIHLLHDSKKIESSGSVLGLNLVAVLKEFGLINHSIWVEQFSQ